MITVGEIRKLKPIYNHKPYVVLNKDNVVMFAGTLNEIINLDAEFGGYYDDCFVQARQYDLYLNDNTKLEDHSKSRV